MQQTSFMKLSIFQVDAFTDKVFGGNPAAVVPLTQWLSDDILQLIARENNLSETAFFVPEENGFHIRWFTPTTEVDLCGHATLATSHVLFNHLSYHHPSIKFKSRSGILNVSRDKDQYLLDFPSDKPKPAENNHFISNCFDRQPIEILKGKADYLLIFKDEEFIRNAVPNLSVIEQLDAEGVIISAPGSGSTHFVSRFFAPQLGIPEDPVTGSAHTVLTPYWAGRLNNNKLQALQVSQRGGKLKCVLKNERVEIGGKASTFMEGKINFQI